MAALTVRGFQGGIIDFYIGANPTQYKAADNLVLDQYNNLVSRSGTVLDFTTNAARARVAASNNSRRIGLLAPQVTGIARNFTILKQVVEKLYYDNGTSMAELVGPGSASAFDLTVPLTDETAFCFTAWNNHTILTHEALTQKPVKVYCDETGALQLRTAGLPRAANTFTATGGAGAAYIYALVRKYTYSVGDVEFVDRSSSVLKEFTAIGTATPGASPGITVGSIPVLANANGEHYATATIKVEIYRTTNAGTTLYYVGEVTNGTTSFADTVSDTTLQTNPALYSSGGEVENDRPPKCKYVHSTSDFTYYAHAIEVASDSTDLELLPQRLYQSKRGDPDSSPASFYADMDEPITGVSSVKSIPVVFCKNSIYRIDGNFDSFGRGGMNPRKISDSVGGLNQLSIVQTLDGLYFASEDGFYFTDGYRVIQLSENFVDTYEQGIGTSLKEKRIYGAHDIKENRVLWAMSFDDNNEGSDNRRIFVLDLKERTFTTMTSGYLGDAVEAETTGDVSGTTISSMGDTTGIDPGQYVVGAGIDPNTYVVSVDSISQITISQAGPTVSGLALKFLPNEPESVFYAQFCPTSLLFANNTLWMGCCNGFTKYFDKTVATDPKLDESISGGGIVELDTMPIYYRYEGPALDFGTTEYRKWVNGIVVKARPRFDLTSDLSIQPQGDNDDSGNPHDLEYILFQSFYPWGDPSVPYGDPRLYQRRRTMVDVKRRFPAGKMRCEYKQVNLKSAFVKKYESSTYVAGVVAGSGITKTVTMTGAEWATGINDYWITFGDDEYVQNYRILSRDSATQITILDETDALTAGSKNWAINAYLKTSLIQLIEYTVYFEVLGTSQNAYHGENAVNV